MIEQDSRILTNIQQTLAVDPNATQRDMAEKSNISLGQLNAVLKRCVERGWIAVKNLNMKKVCYYLTTSGLEEVSRRSSVYMKKSFAMMNEYAWKIQQRIEKEIQSGKKNVILLGDSQIEFIIDWSCNKNNIALYRNLNNVSFANSFVICGEKCDLDIKELEKLGVVNIMEIV